ncbi:MAG: ABC-F family ATP-binding cassette domain-containing protein [Flavobacteriales bacterium]|nr:ABC-F family ATP-binding cassette domain-containing protein [Flavobacteriales bacterium]
MNYLSVEGLSKSYGIKQLYQNISFGLNKGDKVGIVAKNGTGKSTLLKSISGIESADSGTVVFRNGIRVSHLLQEDQFSDAQTIQEVIYSGNHPKMKASKEYNHCVAEGIEGSRMENALEQMNELDAWSFESRVSEILDKLKIPSSSTMIKTLSGGQRKRVALGRVLLEDPDLILLDEPTNHLDLEMIEWLETYLTTSSATILMITHDRYFLENVCSVILELDQGNLYRYEGNYSYFVEKKADRHELESTNVTKAKNLMRKELEWMRRMPKARGTKSKARIDAFYRLKEEASKRVREENVNLNIKTTRLGSKTVEFHNVSHHFDQLKTLDKFSYNFQRFERVGIVGKNGSGKSTFLNLLTGDIEPKGGKIVIGDTVSVGYYKQDGIQLKEDKKVIDVIKDIAEIIPLEKGQKLTASQMLGRFLFPPKVQQQYVHTLSGGEKRRLYLLTVLMRNPNFLILDEPTNDLDINTMNVLEDYLLSFKGCLVVVSHDRYFMDKIADHLFVFEGEGKIKDLVGSYSTWLHEKQQTVIKKPKQDKKITVDNVDEKPKKAGFKEKREFGILEVEIPRLEKKKAELTERIASGALSHEALIEASEELGTIIEELDVKTDRWLELSEHFI